MNVNFPQREVSGIYTINLHNLHAQIHAFLLMRKGGKHQSANHSPQEQGSLH